MTAAGVEPPSQVLYKIAEVMSYTFYNLLHLGSVLALGLLLGALWGLYASPSPNKKLRALLLSLHGLIMFLILLAGFGLIAKIKVPFPWPLWIYGKLTIWLALTLSPVFIKKASRTFHSSKLYSLLYFLVWLILFALVLSALLIVRLK